MSFLGKDLGIACDVQKELISKTRIAQFCASNLQMVGMAAPVCQKELDMVKKKSENEVLLLQLKKQNEQLLLEMKNERLILEIKKPIQSVQDVNARYSNSFAQQGIVREKCTVKTRDKALSPPDSSSRQIAHDTAVVASFNPIAGSHIFFDTPSAGKPGAADQTGALQAAPFGEACTSASVGTRSPNKDTAEHTPQGSALAALSGSAKEREAGKHLLAVKRKIADLQAQHPGDAAKFLASLPVTLKWRCFLGVSPAQRAAIMLEMSVDERKLALSMLRPGERTIAERFLGIKPTEVATSSPAKSPQAQQAARTSLSPSKSPLVQQAPQTSRPIGILTPSVSGASQVLPSPGAPENNVNATQFYTPVLQVQADFVRDSRKLFHSGGGFSLEERLFTHDVPVSLHTTNASVHEAVAAVVNRAAAYTRQDESDVYVSAGTAVTDDASPNNTPRLNKTVSDGLNNTPRVHPTQLQAALQQIGGLDMHMGVSCAKEATAAREEAKDATPSSKAVLQRGQYEKIQVNKESMHVFGKNEAMELSLSLKEFADYDSSKKRAWPSRDTSPDAVPITRLPHQELSLTLKELADNHSSTKRAWASRDTSPDAAPITRLPHHTPPSSLSRMQRRVEIHEENVANGIEKGKLTLEQERSIASPPPNRPLPSSPPPKRPLPLPKVLHAQKEGGAPPSSLTTQHPAAPLEPCSLSGWEHVMQSLTRGSSANKQTERSRILSSHAYSASRPSTLSTSTPPRHTMSKSPLPFQRLGMRAIGLSQASAAPSPPESTPVRMVLQELTVEEKSVRWERYNSPPPARPLPKAPGGHSIAARGGHNSAASPRQMVPSTATVFAKFIGPVEASGGVEAEARKAAVEAEAGKAGVQAHPLRPLSHPLRPLQPYPPNTQTQATNDGVDEAALLVDEATCQASLLVPSAAPQQTNHNYQNVSVRHKGSWPEKERPSLDSQSILAVADAVVEKLTLENEALARRLSAILVESKVKGGADDRHALPKQREHKRQAEPKPSRFRRLVNLLSNRTPPNEYQARNTSPREYLSSPLQSKPAKRSAHHIPHPPHTDTELAIKLQHTLQTGQVQRVIDALGSVDGGVELSHLCMLDAIGSVDALVAQDPAAAKVGRRQADFLGGGRLISNAINSPSSSEKHAQMCKLDGWKLDDTTGLGGDDTTRPYAANLSSIPLISPSANGWSLIIDSPNDTNRKKASQQKTATVKALNERDERQKERALAVARSSRPPDIPLPVLPRRDSRFSCGGECDGGWATEEQTARQLGWATEEATEEATHCHDASATEEQTPRAQHAPQPQTRQLQLEAEVERLKAELAEATAQPAAKTQPQLASSTASAAEAAGSSTGQLINGSSTAQPTATKSKAHAAAKTQTAPGASGEGLEVPPPNSMLLHSADNVYRKT